MIRGFPIPKTSPAEVARAILDGVARGDEDILPDTMSRDVFDRWSKDPTGFARYFGTL
jgi:hypothetical protein